MELVEEIERLLKNKRDYCALDALEELFEEEEIDQICVRKEFSEISKYAMESAVAKEYLELLQENQYDFSHIAEYGNLLNLYIATRGSDIEIVQQLVDLGSSMLEVDEKGNNILHTIALERRGSFDKMLKQVDLAQKIINHTNIDQLFTTNYQGMTPLKLLMNHVIDHQLERNVELIYYLLQLMEDNHINLDEEEILELLMDASNSGNLELFQFVYERFEGDNRKSSDGKTLAHSLVVDETKSNTKGKNRILEVKVEMLDLLSQIDEVDDEGRTPLLHGLANCGVNSIDFWSELVEKGANVNAIDNHGNNALLLSVHNVNATKYLIEHGADVNGQNNMGMTPVINGVLNNKLEVVKLLVEQEADIELMDNQGRSPLSIASEKGNEKMMNVLMGV
ncbi:MAG: ankyrin repeat domain-containing protein [Eubacteriales bacterium]